MNYTHRLLGEWYCRQYSIHKSIHNAHTHANVGGKKLLNQFDEFNLKCGCDWIRLRLKLSTDSNRSHPKLDRCQTPNASKWTAETIIFDRNKSRNFRNCNEHVWWLPSSTLPSSLSSSFDISQTSHRRPNGFFATTTTATIHTHISLGVWQFCLYTHFFSHRMQYSIYIYM